MSSYKTEKVKVSLLKENESNPRTIEPENLDKLVNSIRSFPKMMELRPIVVDKNYVVVGGNMRLLAVKELEMEEVFIIKAEDLSKDELSEFVIKDNVGFGAWDYTMLLEQYDISELEEYGVDVPNTEIELPSEEEYVEDVVKFEEFTLYFKDEDESDFFYTFLSHLKSKFEGVDAISDRVLRYIDEVYEQENMKDHELLMAFLGKDKDIIDE